MARSPDHDRPPGGDGGTYTTPESEYVPQGDLPKWPLDPAATRRMLRYTVESIRKRHGQVTGP